MNRPSSDWQVAGLVRCLVPRRSRSLGLALAGFLAIATVAGAQEKAGPGLRSFNEATAAAWKKAGAKVGWMGQGKGGYVEFLDEPDGFAAPVPAFRFAEWKENVLAKLPDPAMPFGLNLSGTKLTNAGLKELAGLKKLQSLDLSYTQITDAGLKELAGIKTLQTLDLGGTQVTDAGLKALAEIKTLQSLYLDKTNVTDAGLKELAGLKSLERLNLNGTKVTDAGKAALKKALPSLKLDFEK